MVYYVFSSNKCAEYLHIFHLSAEYKQMSQRLPTVRCSLIKILRFITFRESKAF